MLRVRLLTVAILLPVVLALFIYGPAWSVGIFLAVCLAACVFEAASILFPAMERKLGGLSVPVGSDAMSPQHLKFPIASVVIGVAMFTAAVQGYYASASGILTFGLLGCLLIGMFSTSQIELAAARGFAFVVSLSYGVLPWFLVWDLYLMGPHSQYVLLVMAVTWLGDTGGYFGGRYFGGRLFGARKMAPAISPKKTWEGAVSGLFLSLVGALFINAAYGFDLGSSGLMLAAGLFGGIFGQLGDLVESMIKRFAGVKDSGILMPGHGGLLDRIDGILFAAPTIWFIVYYFG